MSHPNRRQFSTITSYEGNTFNIPRHKFSNFTAPNIKNHGSNDPKLDQIHTKRHAQAHNQVSNPKISTLTGNNLNKSPNRQFSKKLNTNINPGRQLNPSLSPKNTKQQKQVTKNIKQTNDQQNLITKSPAKTYQINPATHTIKIQEKCAICQTPTDKCCSLCRKVFYCSPQHQQVDWHTRHKSICQGKVGIEKEKYHHNTNNFTDHYGTNSTNNKFVFYSNNPLEYNNQHKSNDNQDREMQNQTIQRFLELLEQRLVMRAKIMNQVAKINERTPLIVRQSLVRQAEQLLLLSGKITNQQYKPSYSRKITKKDIMQYSSQQWGTQVIINQNGIKLQYIADMVLMAKLYHLCSMSKQARELIISIGKIIQDPQQKRLFLQAVEINHKNQINKRQSNVNVSKALFNTTNTGAGDEATHVSQDQLIKTKNLILESIIQLSEAYNIDKTSESAYKLYIKKIQLQEGIWEQIYAYFNIGVWYMDKTYFDKSVKSFSYALELLDSHKKNISQSIVFKADCLYNIAQGYWAQGEKNNAIQNMQNCYRVRMNGIGKNSMQCSYCLYKLAKWYKDIEKWEECLQYLDQCHRVRKLYQNQPIYEQKLQQIRNLIMEVYEQIKREKKKNNQRLQPKFQRYYEDLITEQRQQQHRQLLKKTEQSELVSKGSVAARLFKDDRQYVHFKVVLSEQVYNQLTSDQVKHLAELFQLTDKRMQKGQAIQTITQSNFVSSLNNQQRDKFFKENQIGKDIKKNFQ